MYHHSKRPTPVVCALAGSLCTIGALGIVARALDNFTHYTLHPSLDLPSFVIAVGFSSAGGVWIARLIIRGLLERLAALQAENDELRDQQTKLATILQAVKDADAQGEINGVRLNKALKLLESQRANEVTQQLAAVRSIKGGA